MKLNKRECRKFANPGLKINAENGLFHADQIGYVVRTATKIIDHHKTLVLYIYSRELAAHGDVRPCMTLFHCQDDFVTLARDEDGSTKWHTAAFDDLGTKWHFTSECAFYSAKDGMRVSSYFKSSTGSGFKPLVEEQFKIQEKRRIERQRLKESRIVSRMSSVKKSLPRGLKHWIHRSIMPAYFFYDYKKGGNDVPGVCSSCGKEVQFSGVKQGVKKICPHCRKELTCKPRSRRGSYMYDRDTVQVIQGTGDGGLVIRIVKVYYSYAGDIPDVQIYENARQFIYQDSDGEVRTESYYHSYYGILTRWKKGTRPVFYAYQYNFSADTRGNLYTENLPDALAGTPWQYCQIDRFYKHFHDPMQSLPFLTEYIKHPKMEHLIKIGFHSIVFDLVNGPHKNCLDETQHRTHRILGVAAEDVEFLRGLDIGLSVLKIFQGYSGMKGRQELLLWQLKNQVSRDISQLLSHMTPHKLMRYLDRQYAVLRLRKTPYGSLRYSSMQDTVSELRDYLEISEKLGYDLRSSCYPKDLQKAHDKAVRHQKQKNDSKIRRDFNAAYKKITGKFDFEYNGLKIIYPNSPNAVIKEGHKLHHCVGSYVERVTRQEAVILFLRQCSDPEQPFFTIEIRDWKIVQVRGMKNCDATPEVQEFIDAWEKRVLNRIDTAA